MFLKFKKDMPAVNFMNTPLRACRLSCYSAVIVVLIINLLKMKQMVDFFSIAVVERLRAEVISK